MATPAAGLPAVAGGWKQVTATLPAAGGTRSFVLWTPADPDAALDACGPQDDPYWTTLWPVGTTLAGRLLAEPGLSGARTLELGCGAGLAGLAAAAAGAEVTASDLEPRAVALAAANAAANGLTVRTTVLDWHAPPVLTAEQRFDRVIGADLVYQPNLHAALLHTLSATLAEEGEAILADPGRSVAADFLHAAADAGWRVRLEDDAGAELWRPRIAGHQLVRLTRGSQAGVMSPA